MSRNRSSRSFEIDAPDLAMQDVAIVGRFENVECHSGLTVHATDTLEAHDLRMQWLAPPSFKVAVVLDGSIDTWLGDRPMLLGGAKLPVGQIWSMTEPTILRRLSQKGMRVRKVVVSVSPHWVRALFDENDHPAPALTRFLSTHRAMATWQPSKRAVSLAQQIISPADQGEPMHKLAVESKALEILHEGLLSLAAPVDRETRPATNTRAQLRAQRIRRYLLENLDSAPSLRLLAHDLGMSVASMQAVFKQTYRTTIAEFCRDLRLQQARLAIEQDGISVSEAAYRAGYANPASFSTAFKRHYGFAPSAAKR